MNIELDLLEKGKSEEKVTWTECDKSACQCGPRASKAFIT